jgi:hypothetical protein
MLWLLAGSIFFALLVVLVILVDWIDPQGSRLF